MQNANYAPDTNTLRTDVSDVAPTILEAEDLHAQGDLKVAARTFLRAIEEDSQSTRAWNGLAVCLFQLGDAAAAVEALETALEIDKDDLPSLANLNQIYWMTGCRAEAVSIARNLLKFLPSSQELWTQLIQTGVECSDRPEVLLVSTGLEMGNVFASMAMALEGSGFVIRGLGPDLTSMLSSTGDAADLKVIQHVLDEANPSVVVLSAAMPSLAMVQTMAMEKDIPVLLLGGWSGPGTPEKVIGIPLNATEDTMKQVCDRALSMVEGTTPRESQQPGSPVITVVVDADSLETTISDCFDKLVLQGVHPCLFEVVVVTDDGAGLQAKLELSKPPFSMTVAARDASIEEIARGKVIVEAPVESLHEPGALMRRVYETCVG